MKDCALGDTPIAKGDKFSLLQCPRNEFEKKEMDKIPYAFTVESLIYTQVCTRPDIVYIVGMLGRYLSNPGLDRSTRERRTAISDDYVVYLQEHEFDIGLESDRSS